MRRDYERAMWSIGPMAREAAAIFNDLAKDPRCDMAMADRMAYECENYECLVEDWLAILRMYDLTQAGQYRAIAPIARARQQARLALMAHCEKAKETYVVEALTQRNHSIFMQLFADIADYVDRTDEPKLDLLDLSPILSEEFWSLR